MRRKRQMYKSHCIRGDEVMKLEYKKFVNHFKKIKTLAKKQYNPNKQEKSRTNPRKTWEVLCALLPGKSHCSSPLPSNINFIGCCISDNQRITNKFNFFFSKVDENLSNNCDDNDPNFKQFLTNKVDSFVFIEPPCVTEVFNLIKSRSLHIR